MDYTPETPHVPPSPEVRRAQLLGEHRKQVRKARRNHNAPWYILFVLGTFGLVVAYNSGAYVVVTIVAVVYLALVAYLNVVGRNLAYRRGYSAGVAMGALGAVSAFHHAQEHIARGEDPCDAAVGVKAHIPDIWEHEFVMSEIRDNAPNTFSITEDDEPDDGTPLR